MRTREQKAMWLRVSGALALIGYLVLLFYAHVHVAHEAHEHGEAAHASHHAEGPGHDHDEAPHPAADHSLTASIPTPGKVNQIFVWHFARVAELVFAPAEKTESGFTWIEDRPKHPPPRLPEQPRSPPFA